MKFYSMLVYAQLVLFYLATQLGNVSAKITLIRGGRTLTLPTMNYFQHDQSYYNYSGILYDWTWDVGAGTVKPWPVNMSDPFFVQFKKQSNRFKSTAIYINYGEYFTYPEHITIAQFGEEVEKLARQFDQLRLPPIKLLVFVFPGDAGPMVWGSNSNAYVTDKPSSKPEGPPSIATTFVDSVSSIDFLEFTGKHVSGTGFHAEPEPGPVNEVFLSSGYLAHKWICFVLVLLALIYTCSRIVLLAIRKQLILNMRMVIFTLAVMDSIVFMMYLNTPLYTYYNVVLQIILVSTTILNYLLLFIYWSIHARHVFSLILVVSFRVSVVCIFTVEMTTSIIGLCFQIWSVETIYKWGIDEGFKAIKIFSVTANIILLLGFTIWFSLCAYRVRRHSKPYKRFIQLTMFTGLATLTGVTSGMTVSDWAIFAISRHATLVIRIIVCLSIMGIAWPKLRETTTHHTPLNGMTTIGATDTTLVNDDHGALAAPLARTLSRISEKFKRQTSVIVSETVSVQVVSYQDAQHF
ncbi:hypothetical protein BDF22DRAFT_679211 [Syncephalis plumigaleata]|nr:hypothetical protein BDF22DRAFT_679211 [Syncephalis plumigaleata]